MKKRLISRRETLALDKIDLAILEILQENARTSNAEIARRLGLAPSAILERIRKLEVSNVVEGYPARLSARALGLDLIAFAFVRSEEGRDAVEVAASLAALPEIQEVHHVAGEDCLLVKLRAADTGSLGEFLRARVGTIKGVRATRTTIVLETVKETSGLAIQAEAPETPAPRRRPRRRRKSARRPEAAE